MLCFFFFFQIVHLKSCYTIFYKQHQAEIYKKSSKTVACADIFWEYRFQQEFWGPPETETYVIVIFKELFSVLDMYTCDG